MKICIESTSRLVEFVTESGAVVVARIWEGVTESGIPVHCFVTRIAADKGADLSQFERELQEQRAPSAAMDAYPLRMIL